MTLRWTSWAATDVGTVRTRNEDAFVDNPGLRLWAVADGAGGHDHGEVASAELKAALGEPLAPGASQSVQQLRERVADVHAGLRARAEAEAAAKGAPVTIASTLVVFLADGPHFACLWCGDSRAYLLRDGDLIQLSRDHSLVQEMVDAGVLAAEAAESHPHANILTRAVGADDGEPKLDKVTGRAEAGDRFLLCSDGLFKALDAGRIGSLTQGDDPAHSLISAALAAFAKDNITAVVIEAASLPPQDDLLTPLPGLAETR